MGALEEFFPWLDEKKRQAMQALARAYEEATANPVDSVMRGLRGALRGGGDLADTVATSIPGGQAPGFGPAISAQLGQSDSPVEQAGEMLGPPVAKIAKPLGAIFAGAKVMNPTVLNRLKAAEEELLHGKSKRDTYNMTGAYIGPDMNMKAFISDYPSQMIPGFGGEQKLEQAINHPDLFKAYPEMRDYKTVIRGRDYGGGAEGVWNSPENTIKIWGDNTRDIQSVLLHEIQHGIQTIEGWPGGTNTDAMKDWLTKNPKATPAIAAGMNPDALQKAASLLYRHEMGEAEARAVQNMWGKNAQGYPLGANMNEAGGSPGYDVFTKDLWKGSNYNRPGETFTWPQGLIDLIRQLSQQP